MNIKRAKEEIKNTVKVYLAKDEYGNYRIPYLRQRPILLIGPPGVGKTQIMEQVAGECKVALVAYTITHHTRQSAVGLPFIQKKLYNGKEYSVTEYTMSEIIASVYDKIELTGLKEGILFIDEINCVSETLAPTMLQFLQYKSFGNRRIPEGWIIITAGNPPEYNRSVRDFDTVTLDRVRKIDIEPDLSSWKEYAYKQGIHGSIISYLDIRKENFYRVETTPDGTFFATARGWEDLSEMLLTCEKLKLPVTEDLVIQYIQYNSIARDFANYYELYNKYKEVYSIEEILKGNITQNAIAKIGRAPFDEKLNVIGLLLSSLNDKFKEVYQMDLYVDRLFNCLKEWKQQIFEQEEKGVPEEFFKKLLEQEEEKLAQLIESGQSTRTETTVSNRIGGSLKRYAAELKSKTVEEPARAFELVKLLFDEDTRRRKDNISETSEALEHVFEFMETAFGESQEMVIFVTELTVNFYSSKFIGEYGSEMYTKYNRSLLFEERHKEIIEEINKL
ncbi:AAA family ATPase [Anaerocolumna sedimenticola]|uniref:AAA family ATPase n=1 Tax=Anaerocolumna sedimenticola TaxID=2696063 RepID=A0A6P1TK80_9FIRM|nr:AAA family ATPase [Anaerocolumna sedimenticola]QHQ61610.1 AAA family ATPase [Anaerocolumna sedimenticola]